MPFLESLSHRHVLHTLPDNRFIVKFNNLAGKEIYKSIEVPDMPLFVRLDGWAFHRLTKNLKLKKPFDKFFTSCLVKATSEFFLPFNPSLAYVFSDEISLLFLKNTTFKRVEKIDSVFSGYAASILSRQLNKKYKVDKLSFDCRCIPMPKKSINKYLIWRQAEAFRNHVNLYAQYALAKEGLNSRVISKRLKGLKSDELRKLLLNKNIYPYKTPAWQRRGVLLYKEFYKKKGYDPVKKKHVVVKRQRIKSDWNPPLFNSKEGKNFLSRIVEK